VPNNCEMRQNVIAVKEYSPSSTEGTVTDQSPEPQMNKQTNVDTDQEDLVFIHVNGTVASS